MNVLQTSYVKVTTSIQPVAKLNLNPSEPKVIGYDYTEEFPNENQILDHKRDSDHPSKKKCNQPTGYKGWSQKNEAA